MAIFYRHGYLYYLIKNIRTFRVQSTFLFRISRNLQHVQISHCSYLDRPGYRDFDRQAGVHYLQCHDCGHVMSSSNPILLSWLCTYERQWSPNQVAQMRTRPKTFSCNFIPGSWIASCHISIRSVSGFFGFLDLEICNRNLFYDLCNTLEWK